MRQYRRDVSSSQFGLQSQCDPNKNSSELFAGHWQIASKVYMEKQELRKSQHFIKGEPSRRTDAI